MGKERRGREGGTDIGGCYCRWEWKTRENEVIGVELFPVLLVVVSGLALLSHSDFLVSQVCRNYHGIATMLLPSSLQDYEVDVVVVAISGGVRIMPNIIEMWCV
ncbi:hypothetical protein PIB30_097538 [Stylosanthes scabra]|uniref:Uncharacterized protein n=1 Tax=Stylosanthes scabra TaxID=79078 RepID=A0ABU6VXD1_9FABA|nr:hypothetical protein [Stylosanthes scabra]